MKKPDDGVNVAQRKKEPWIVNCIIHVGHIDCMDVFINKGADVNCTDKDFDWHHRGKLCRKMGLTYETKYTTQERLECFTPLIYAAANNRLEGVQLLGEAGADVNLAQEK